ncbi:hypothetical protein [Paractinoplanes hotanensis]|uniref:Uncharacterized protein n=1 Tax=Paractinoplanes hotanensis TaxID=2906497 RepID=A0ABT0Y1M2_9ACTN|nr:hypothetical protein [Actinoplanes hotanensis]MCM4079760.1 hypothetical protein [Actinoplanes hotanensis]
MPFRKHFVCGVADVDTSRPGVVKGARIYTEGEIVVDVRTMSDACGKVAARLAAADAAPEVTRSNVLKNGGWTPG